MRSHPVTQRHCGGESSAQGGDPVICLVGLARLQCIYVGGGISRFHFFLSQRRVLLQHRYCTTGATVEARARRYERLAFIARGHHEASFGARSPRRNGASKANSVGPLTQLCWTDLSEIVSRLIQSENPGLEMRHPMSARTVIDVQPRQTRGPSLTTHGEKVHAESRSRWPRRAPFVAALGDIRSKSREGDHRRRLPASPRHSIPTWIPRRFLSDSRRAPPRLPVGTSSGDAAAVDHEGGAGYERGGVGRQEENGAGDLLGGTDAAHRAVGGSFQVAFP